MKRVIAILLSVVLMVFSAVTVLGAALPFKDIKTKDWFYNFVKTSYEAGVLKGTSWDKFSPYTNMTRAMFVQALANNSTTYKQIYKPQKFVDVSSTDWHFNAVQWAAEMKIISGTGEGKFSPSASITRADMCVMLQNYALVSTPVFSYPQEVDTNIFKDFDQIPTYAKQAVYWAYHNKIVVGTGNSRFSPKGILNRAEAATVLTKAGKIKDPSYATYKQEFSWKGQRVLTMDLPEYWKNACRIIYGAEGSDVIASFYSKKNETTTSEAGLLFQLRIFPSDNFVESKDSNQKLGEIRMAGKNYVVAAIVSSTPYKIVDMENHVRMKRDSGKALQTICFAGVPETLMLNGRAVLTLPMPEDWRGKYIVKTIQDKRIAAGLDFYEIENFGTQYGGKLFSLVLLPHGTMADNGAKKISELSVNGKKYILYVYYVLSGQYDGNDQTKAASYLELWNNAEIPLNNIWYEEEVIQY